ncbi:uncharacterized protein ACBT44_015123 [Syngnathus typhle]
MPGSCHHHHGNASVLPFAITMAMGVSPSNHQHGLSLLTRITMAMSARRIAGLRKMHGGDMMVFFFFPLLLYTPQSSMLCAWWVGAAVSPPPLSGPGRRPPRHHGAEDTPASLWVTSCQTTGAGCRLRSYPPFPHFIWPFGIHIPERRVPNEEVTWRLPAKKRWKPAEPLKSPAPARKTSPIHLRPQRDRMRATYSQAKASHKNSRKKRFTMGAWRSLLKCATIQTILICTGAASLKKLTRLYCSPGPHCSGGEGVS